MTIVRSLKQLLAAMGGTPETTDNQTITEVLADIYMYKANTTGVKFDTIMEALDNIATVTEGGGGDGWAVHTLVDDSSVELEYNSEAYAFVCPYTDVTFGVGDFLTLTIDGDFMGSVKGVIDTSGWLYPDLRIAVEGGTVYFDFKPISGNKRFLEFDVYYETENPPTQAPSISLKVERIGDTSGEQPWVEGGGGD